MRYKKIKPRIERPIDRVRRIEQITKWLIVAWSLLLGTAFVLRVAGPDRHWGIGAAIIVAGVLDIGLAGAVYVLQRKASPLPWYMEVDGAAVGEKQYEKDVEHLKLSRNFCLAGMMIASLVIPTLLILHLFGLI